MPLTFELQPDDQIIAKGQQLAWMIFSSDQDHTLWPRPGTELTIDLEASSLTSPSLVERVPSLLHSIKWLPPIRRRHLPVSNQPSKRGILVVGSINSDWVVPLTRMPLGGETLEASPINIMLAEREPTRRWLPLAWAQVSGSWGGSATIGMVSNSWKP